MPNETTPHTQPALNTDPAEDERDTNQLTAEGTPGSDAGIYEDLQDAQTAGSRNERVMGYEGVKHNTEGFTAAGYGEQPKAAPGATGITNQPVAEERATEERLQRERTEASDKDPAQNDEQQTPADIAGDLLGTKAAKAEKVEISDMRPVR